MINDSAMDSCKIEGAYSFNPFMLRSSLKIDVWVFNCFDNNL